MVNQTKNSMTKPMPARRLLSAILCVLTLALSSCGTSHQEKKEAADTSAAELGIKPTEKEQVSSLFVALKDKADKVDYLVGKIKASSDFHHLSALDKKIAQNNINSWRQMMKVNLQLLEKDFKNYEQDRFTAQEMRASIAKSEQRQDSLRWLIEKWNILK